MRNMLPPESKEVLKDIRYMSFIKECVKQNFLEENVISVMSYLCS